MIRISRRLSLVLLSMAIGSLSMGAANAGGCGLLSQADVTKFLGADAPPTERGDNCSWSAGTKKLVAITYKTTSGAMMYQGAKQAAAKDGKSVVTEESGIGDQAFSTLQSFGVAMIMIKQGRMLQLQYWTGTAGTAKDAEALRPIAKRAIASF